MSSMGRRKPITAEDFTGCLQGVLIVAAFAIAIVFGGSIVVHHFWPATPVPTQPECPTGAVLFKEEPVKDEYWGYRWHCLATVKP